MAGNLHGSTKFFRQNNQTNETNRTNQKKETPLTSYYFTLFKKQFLRREEDKNDKDDVEKLREFHFLSLPVQG